MCVYRRICVYINTSVCISTHLCVYRHISVYIETLVHIHTHLCVYRHTCVLFNAIFRCVVNAYRKILIREKSFITFYAHRYRIFHIFVVCSLIKIKGITRYLWYISNIGLCINMIHIVGLDCCASFPNKNGPPAVLYIYEWEISKHKHCPTCNFLNHQHFFFQLSLKASGLGDTKNNWRYCAL